MAIAKAAVHPFETLSQDQLLRRLFETVEDNEDMLDRVCRLMAKREVDEIKIETLQRRVAELEPEAAKVAQLEHRIERLRDELEREREEKIAELEKTIKDHDSDVENKLTDAKDEWQIELDNTLDPIMDERAMMLDLLGLNEAEWYLFSAGCKIGKTPKRIKKA